MSQYSDKYSRVSNQANNKIIGAFADAETELNSASAPITEYLELQWDGDFIRRGWDNEKVTNLTLSEQLRLYPQLDGLFKKAIYALILPS